MKRNFTAVYKKSGKWYSAWIEEIPGVNTQGKTLTEAKQNLREALQLVIETNKAVTDSHQKKSIIRESLTITV